MSTKQPVYDVFLSHVPAEVAWAVEIERKFNDAGLTVFRGASTVTGKGSRDSLWAAISESSAMVALIAGRGAMPPLFSFEIGAAMSWKKPVYILFNGARPNHLPSYAENLPAFSAEQIDQVVELVARGARDLSDEQRDALIETYASLGVPVDHLLEDSSVADELTRRFNQSCGTKVSAERLLRELLRLRKQSALRPRQHA